MSRTLAKADGVTVLILTTDPDSACPPLCQILRSLCYTPVCCSVSQHLRRVQGFSLSLLGTLHVMNGFLNISLGLVLLFSPSSWWQIERTMFPFWLGTVVIIFGIMSILTEKYPSPCLVTLNVILNVAGVALAVAAITLYSISMGNIWLWWGCGGYWSRSNKPSPYEDLTREKCLEGKTLILILLRSINAVLIAVSVLELCVTCSSVVLGIKALQSNKTTEDKSTDDPEHYKDLLEEDASNSTA